MTALGEVFYSDIFKNMTVSKKGKVSTGVRFSMDSDSLELTLQYEDSEVDELAELLRSYKLKKRFYRLKNGIFVTLVQDGGFDNIISCSVFTPLVSNFSLPLKWCVFH